MNGMAQTLLNVALKPRETDGEIDKIKALFAQAVNTALEEDYVDTFNICMALGIPHPEEDEEYEEMWQSLDDKFIEFFGYSRHNIPVLR